MYLVLIILILTITQGHTDLNHENNKYLITSESIQAMAVMFAVKIVRLKVKMTIASTMDTRSQILFNLQYLRQYLSYYIKNNMLYLAWR